MFDIKTPMTYIHRPVRTAVGTFIAKPGSWAWIDNNGKINLIPNNSSTQAQPRVLKPVLGDIASTPYHTHDTRPLARVSTVECVFRAAVDGDGYQKFASDGTTPITYTKGMKLTVAYRIPVAPTADLKYSAAADIGKLKPSFTGDIVVAVAEYVDFGNLVYTTVTPYRDGSDSEWDIEGSGSDAIPLVVPYGGVGSRLPRLFNGVGVDVLDRLGVNGVGDFEDLYHNGIGNNSLPELIAENGAGMRTRVFNGSGSDVLPVLSGSGAGTKTP